MSKPFAGLSLDLDNEWTYLKTHGDSGWEAYPSYFAIVVPRVLEFLKQRNLRITFFVVGKDATLDYNRPYLHLIVEAGHEIGNHSYHHEPWLHLYSRSEIESEFIKTEDCLGSIAGKDIQGFRGPGFSLSESVLSVLHDRNYLYDASTFPTFLGPLARTYYFMTAKLSHEETEQRKKLFGSYNEGFRPIKPYQWSLNTGKLLEMPVTTMPLLRLPFHVSYLQYLASFSPMFANQYMAISLNLCSCLKVSPSLLLHPLDFLGHEDVPSLSFFPAMRISYHLKMERISQYIDQYCRKYTVLPLFEIAKWLIDTADLPSLYPKFK